MSNIVITQTKQLASTLNLDGDPKELMDVLKATAFKVKDGVVSDAQMTALLIVAQQYGLNPWVRQIYAFPDKQSGIVPVVGVDGWLAIINKHPEYDGCEFTYSEEMVTPDGGKECPAWCECKIYRKDRTRPVVVREFLDEVYRPAFEGFNRDTKQKYTVSGPWQSHPKRFLRHKALIQCARVAFGFSGIYEPDDAEDIIKNQEIVINPMPGEEIKSKADVNAILESIKTMSIADFSSIDKNSLTQDEQAKVSAAFRARKKQIAESQVVATQHKETEQTGIDWYELISSAADESVMIEISASIPDNEMKGVVDSINDGELLNRLYKSLAKEKQKMHNDIFDGRAQELEG